MDKMSWNVIWKGCKPTGKLEVVSEEWMARDEYYSITKCMGGIKELKTAKEAQEWYGNMSVGFGEEGGSFKILGGWRGSFKDLKEGKTDFQNANNIHRLIDDEAEEKHFPSDKAMLVDGIQAVEKTNKPWHERNKELMKKDVKELESIYEKVEKGN